MAQKDVKMHVMPCVSPSPPHVFHSPSFNVRTHPPSSFRTRPEPIHPPIAEPVQNPFTFQLQNPFTTHSPFQFQNPFRTHSPHLFPETTPPYVFQNPHSPRDPTPTQFFLHIFVNLVFYLNNGQDCSFVTTSQAYVRGGGREMCIL